MRTVFILLLSVFFLPLQAQTVHTQLGSSNAGRTFKNQGEQEAFWAAQLFEKEYTPQVYDIYSGDIITRNSSYSYGKQVLVIANTNQQLKAIFFKGLFYPSIITGVTLEKAKSKEELDSMTSAQRFFYGFTSTDSLVVSRLEELPELSNSPTQKRFRFWLVRIGIANPQVCFIELTNEHATIQTDLDAFLEGAVLTYYKAAWMAI